MRVHSPSTNLTVVTAWGPVWQRRHEDDDPECDGAAHKFDPHLTFGGLRSLVRLNQPRREGHSA